MAMVWATQWRTSSEKFEPSLDRSWCEFFKIIKNHGPKHPSPGCNVGPKFPPHAGYLSEKNVLICPVWRCTLVGLL